MKVQTYTGSIYDVVVQKDGSWQFTWEDEDGVNTQNYNKEAVHKFLIEFQYWEIIPDEELKQELAPHYAAAFNMWLDDYSNSPQAYEDSHSTAIRHLTEKLNGSDLSYGQICEEMLIKYLEKVK